MRSPRLKGLLVAVAVAAMAWASGPQQATAAEMPKSLEIGGASIADTQRRGVDVGLTSEPFPTCRRLSNAVFAEGIAAAPAARRLDEYLQYARSFSGFVGHRRSAPAARSSGTTSPPSPRRKVAHCSISARRFSSSVERA